MEKITFSKFNEIMSEYNRRFPEKQDTAQITGVIVFKPENWPGKAYTEQQRSYRVSNANRCFQAGKIANSMFGNCLDGKDVGVRLDWYNWAVDYCYID